MNKAFTILIVATLFTAFVIYPGWGAKTFDPEKVRLSYISLFAGTENSFGVDATAYLDMAGNYMNGSLYFMKRQAAKRDVMAIDLGPRYYFNLAGEMYSYISGNIGLVMDSYGSPGYSFGPTQNDNYFYASIKCGAMYNWNSFVFFGSLEPMISKDPPVYLFKAGIGHD